MNKKKIKKLALRIGMGLLTFATSLAVAYFLTPNAVKRNAFNNSDPQTVEENGLPSHFVEFVNRLSEDTGIGEESFDEEETYYGFAIGLDNFSISFKKDEQYAINNIGLVGDIDVTIKTIKDISFNLDVTANYNDKKVPLELGYVDKTAYFGLYDLRMKVGSTTIDELFGNSEKGVDSLLKQIFIASKENGGINFDIEAFIDDTINELIDGKLGGLIANADFSNLTSSLNLGGLEEGEQGIGLKVSEQNITNGWNFFIDLQIRNDSLNTDAQIVLTVNEDYRLKRVNLGTIDLGKVVIKGALNIETIKDYKVIAPDQEAYRRYNANYNYVEVINYKGWLQKLANFIDEDNQKFGIEFSLDLDQKDDLDIYDIGTIDGSINADFSKTLDFGKYTGNNGSEKILNNFRNTASLGIDLSVLGQTQEEYSNLAINYIDGQGYLNLNEVEDEQGHTTSVIKSKVDTETMNWIIDELPGMFANLGGENSSNSAVSSLFSFLTESPFMEGIKNGDYSVILDLIKSIRNDENTISIDLDLSSLGFGDNANVSLMLDSRTGENNKVLNLEVSDFEVGSIVLNVKVNSSECKMVEIGDEESYDSLSFLPTVFDQVYSILDTKQAGFVIDGSLLDENNLGIVLSGEGQFDYGVKYGFGNLTIDQYKYKNKGIWYSHKIALDVDNKSGDYSKNNAHFVYGEKVGDNIKGKVTVQSILDIVDVVKTFVNDNKNNPKFTKFLDPIIEMISMGELGEIINSKDYFRLLKNDLVKSAKRNNNQLDLIIGGALFDLESDINIRVNLLEDKIDTLELSNLVISGKTLNLRIGLRNFEENKESSVDKSDLNSFMDLNSISLLLKFGINTTKNNYYHLTANIDLDLSIIDLFKFKIDVYIVVKDSYVKIYGAIEDSKILFAVQKYNDITTKALKSEFTFETYPDDDPNKENGIGGYFHFKITDTRRLGGERIYHYKTTSKNLLEADNLVKYLLSDFLYMRDWIIDTIGGINLNSDEEKEAGDFTKTFTDTGFKYVENENKWSIGLNLDVLTGINALKDLEINIYGNDSESFARLSGNLNIEAMKLGSLSTKIGIGFTVQLEETDPSIKDWSSSIQNKFASINNVLFSNEYLNNPDKYLGQ